MLTPISTPTRTTPALLAILAVLATLLTSCANTTKTTSHTATQASANAATSTSTDASAAASSAPTPTLPNGVVARVGNKTITQRQLNAWMQETLGDDYYTVATHKAPTNVVSEPANYPACVKTLTTLLPTPDQKPAQPIPTPQQLQTKCEEIHNTIRTQALTYLIETAWIENFATQHHITVTNIQTNATLTKTIKERYRNNTNAFQQALTNKNRTLAQELILTHSTLLDEALTQQIIKEGQHSKLLKEANTNPNTATCPPNTDIEHCENYTPPKQKYATTNNGTADKPLLEIARWRPATSHGLTGQPATE